MGFIQMAFTTRKILHQENQSASRIGDVKQVKIEDLPLFEFKIISSETNNFVQLIRLVRMVFVRCTR